MSETTPVIEYNDLDPNDVAYMASAFDKFIGGHYMDISATTFHTPNIGYTGYASSGYRYNAGVVDGTDLSSWSKEGDDSFHASNSSTRNSLYRSDVDRFPTRFFLLYKEEEIQILNADTLSIWMRIGLQTPLGPPAFISGTAKIYKAVFSNGIICVYGVDTPTDKWWVYIINFRRDCIVYHTATSQYCRKYIWHRHNTAPFNLTDTGSVYPFTNTGDSLDISTSSNNGDPLTTEDFLCLSLNYVGSIVRGAIGAVNGFFAFDCEAYVHANKTAWPKFKNHLQEKAFTINAVNVALTVSGFDVDFVDATNDWTTAAFIVVASDLVKIVGGGQTRYLKVLADPVVNQNLFSLSTKGIVSTGLYRYLLPETDQLATISTSVETSLETTNTYKIFRPVRDIQILADGSFIILTTNKIYNSNQTYLWDTTSNSTLKLYDGTATYVPMPITDQHSWLGGVAHDRENMYIIVYNSIYKYSLDRLTENPEEIFKFSDIPGTLNYIYIVKTPGSLITVDPSSSHLFFSVEQSHKYAVAEIDPATGEVWQVLSDPANENEVITFVHGFRNRLGPPEVSS